MSFCICNHILCTTIDKDAHSQDLAATTAEWATLIGPDQSRYSALIG